MPYKDPEEQAAYQRKYQREYNRKLRKDPKIRAALSAAKRSPEARERDNAARRRRYAADGSIREAIVDRERIRRGTWTLEGRKWMRSVLLGDPCSYCYGQSDCADHIVPVHHGGQGRPDNLTAACTVCNGSKQDETLLFFLLRRLA